MFRLLFYQEENCKKAGFDFAGAVNIYDMIELANKARDMDKKLYFFNRHSLMQKSLSLYLRDHKTLDTEEFRSLAEALYNFSTNSEYFGDSLALSDFASNKNNNYLFSTEDTRVYQTLEYLIDRSDLKAVSLTGSNSINSAYCIFLCVNPKSDNLDSTLEYISSICEYMMNLKDSYMLTDRSKYTDSSYAGELYAQYENSVIDFTVSDEVFTSDFGRYLNGEIDLDTLIRDAERKLTMYYNE